MARPNHDRIAELIGGGMSPSLAKRQERAERQGFSSYTAYDQAKRREKAQRIGYSGTGQMRKAREAAREKGDRSKLRPGDTPPPAKPDRRQIIPGPGGSKAVRTRRGSHAGGMDTVVRHLDRAKGDSNVKVIIGTREGKSLTLYGRGGWTAAGIRVAMAQKGYPMTPGGLLAFFVDQLGGQYGHDVTTADDIADVQVVMA